MVVTSASGAYTNPCDGCTATCDSETRHNSSAPNESMFNSSSIAKQGTYGSSNFCPPTTTTESNLYRLVGGSLQQQRINQNGTTPFIKPGMQRQSIPPLEETSGADNARATLPPNTRLINKSHFRATPSTGPLNSHGGGSPTSSPRTTGPTTPFPSYSSPLAAAAHLKVNQDTSSRLQAQQHRQPILLQSSFYRNRLHQSVNQQLDQQQQQQPQQTSCNVSILANATSSCEERYKHPSSLQQTQPQDPDSQQQAPSRQQQQQQQRRQQQTFQQCHNPQLQPSSHSVQRPSPTSSLQQSPSLPVLQQAPSLSFEQSPLPHVSRKQSWQPGTHRQSLPQQHVLPPSSPRQQVAQQAAAGPPPQASHLDQPLQWRPVSPKRHVPSNVTASSLTESLGHAVHPTVQVDLQLPVGPHHDELDQRVPPELGGTALEMTRGTSSSTTKFLSKDRITPAQQQPHDAGSISRVPSPPESPARVLHDDRATTGSGTSAIPPRHESLDNGARMSLASNATSTTGGAGDGSTPTGVGLRNVCTLLICLVNDVVRHQQQSRAAAARFLCIFLSQILKKPKARMFVQWRIWVECTRNPAAVLELPSTELSVANFKDIDSREPLGLRDEAPLNTVSCETETRGPAHEEGCLARPALETGVAAPSSNPRVEEIDVTVTMNSGGDQESGNSDRERADSRDEPQEIQQEELHAAGTTARMSQGGPMDIKSSAIPPQLSARVLCSRLDWASNSLPNSLDSLVRLLSRIDPTSVKSTAALETSFWRSSG